jgi:dTDP-4-amino-4,6-dideoxygalactose transaminase
MNELEAAIGLGYLDIYNNILEKRKRNFLYIRERFKQFSSFFSVAQTNSDEEMAPYAFATVVRKGAGFSRNEFMKYLEESGIETRTLFLSMPTQCPGFKFLKYKLGDFPVAEFVGKNGLHIGIHQGIGREEIDLFIRTTKRFIEENL